MNLINHLTSTFNYNDQANKRLIEKIKLLPDKTECIKFFSHLINCQFKWMARVLSNPKQTELDWWDPLYELSELENKWSESINLWLNYLKTKTEDEINKEVTYIGFDGGPYAATPADIALQLNYHSIHHRAQMQTIIRKQGLEPDFLDYIGTKYRKL